MLSVLASVVAIDQISKALISKWLGQGPGSARFEIFEPVLALRYARNSGAAFGLLSGKALLLTAIALVVIAALVAIAGRTGQRSAWQTAALGLVAGGATGNVLDRLRLGHVIDFIDVSGWPTFNLADSAITVGIGIVIVAGLHQKPQERSDRTEGQRDADSAG